MRFLSRSFSCAALITLLLATSVSLCGAAEAKDIIFGRDSAQVVWSYVRSDGTSVWTIVHRCDRIDSDPLVGPVVTSRHYRVAQYETAPDGQSEVHTKMEIDNAKFSESDVLHSANLRFTGSALRTATQSGVIVSQEPIKCSVNMRLAGTGPITTHVENMLEPSGLSELITTVNERNATISGSATLGGQSLMGPSSSATPLLQETVRVRSYFPQ